MSDQAIIPIAQAEVLIAGFPVIAVLLPDGQLGAVLTMLCAMLNLKPSTQAHLIHKHPVLSGALVQVALATPGGTQTTNVLLTWGIALWAAGLQRGRRPPAYRELLLTIQREAGRTIAAQFAQQTTSSTFASSPPPSQAPASQSVWQEWHTLGDRLEARDEELRREVRNQLAVVQYDQHSQEMRIAALEARDARPAGGLSNQQLGHLCQLARQVRAQQGYRVVDLLTGLADHFRVEDFTCLQEKDWPAVLVWFESLLLP